MTDDTALPTADTSAAASGAETDAPSANDLNQRADPGAQTDQTEVADADDAAAEETKKPEKTPEQREIDRMRRGLDRKTRMLAEARAQLDQVRGLRQPQIGDTSQHTEGDGDTLTLSRADLQAHIQAEAEKLAPSVQEQRAVIEHRQKVVTGLAKALGQERFDTLAADLDDAIGGLRDQRGNPKPVADAIFESDMPQALIEHLADPDNADEAEAIGRMSGVAAGRAIARIEARITAAKAANKPQRSAAAAPLAAVRGSGGVTNGAPNPADTKAWIRWRNEQDRKGL